ncbi:MAG: 50S ribosomal protein L22, partial [Pseudobdellovibrionaceae bacterium]
MEVKASLKYARVGAQKARLVVDVVRGKDVNQAVKDLTFLNKKTASLVKKLIESAVANAEYKKVIDIDKLYVKSIWVDQGPVLKRFRPRAQGRA